MSNTYVEPGPSEADTTESAEPVATEEATSETEPPETEPTETTEADTSEDADDEPSAADDALRRTRKQAATYRERLRSAEAIIDQLRRSIIDAAVERDGLKPAALWAAGYDPADLTDADGTIDAEALRDAIAEARERLGITRSPGSADQFSRGRGSFSPPAPTWGDVMRSKDGN